MKENVCNRIGDLVEYAIRKELAQPSDRVFFCNVLCDVMGLSAYLPDRKPNPVASLTGILDGLCDDAIERGIIEDCGITGRDLFDTRLMGILTPRPSEVIRTFRERYEQSPKAATEYYYRLSCDSDYIRTERIKRDVKWVYSGKYGNLDITINLSKPEKDPRAIAAAKSQTQTGYPKCAICRENEGFAGSLTQAARQSHRLIPLTLDGECWYLQYSPYVYYNEHCIVLSGCHTPMKIDRHTFIRQMEFITQFPHYMLGSNADLPIVGGSILTHDHMQGGHYTFAMERAETEAEFRFPGFENVRAGILHWPMSVIRLNSENPEELIELSDRILRKWRTYSDPDADILAETDGTPHNTVTPISRRRGDRYETDLVLRNNRTTAEHPLGLFHPHAEKHHIKKENIGLIEVMGLAVLPARLKEEMALLSDALMQGKNPAGDERIAKHAEWAAGFAAEIRGGTPESAEAILQREVGKTFEGVLEDAGVYKCTPEGRTAFFRFLHTVK